MAYVSEHNVFVEDLATGEIKKLTDDKGTRKLINGTFDWVYEEEFSAAMASAGDPIANPLPIGRLMPTRSRDYYMLNTTDSVYSKGSSRRISQSGEKPSPARGSA